MQGRNVSQRDERDKGRALSYHHSEVKLSEKSIRVLSAVIQQLQERQISSYAAQERHLEVFKNIGCAVW